MSCCADACVDDSEEEISLDPHGSFLDGGGTTGLQLYGDDMSSVSACWSYSCVIFLVSLLSFFAIGLNSFPSFSLLQPAATFGCSHAAATLCCNFLFRHLCQLIFLPFLVCHTCSWSCNINPSIHAHAPYDLCVPRSPADEFVACCRPV
jgi:hypothetical protein